MRQRRIVAAVMPAVGGIVSNCDVCGGLMFNAQRYMHMDDAYSPPSSTIRFPYELKKIFDRILHELQYLHREHPHHSTLDLDQLDRIFEYRFIQSSSYSFPVTRVNSNIFIIHNYLFSNENTYIPYTTATKKYLTAIKHIKII